MRKKSVWMVNLVGLALVAFAFVMAPYYGTRLSLANDVEESVLKMMAAAETGDEAARIVRPFWQIANNTSHTGRAWFTLSLIVLGVNGTMFSINLRHTRERSW